MDPKLVDEGIDLWNLFQELLRTGRGGLRAMDLLVQQAAEVTDKALEKFLAKDLSGASASGERCPWRRQFEAASEVSPRIMRLIREGKDPGSSSGAVLAFQKLRNILLASQWLGPATQYSLGLVSVGRYDMALDVLAKTEEVYTDALPYSALHVATAMHRALCAADAKRPQHEVFQHLSRAAEVCRGAYGSGAETLEVLMEARLAKKDATADWLARCLKLLQGSSKPASPVAKEGYISKAAATTERRKEDEPPSDSDDEQLSQPREGVCATTFDHVLAHREDPNRLQLVDLAEMD
eukprot:TRINITY_DN38195_c0_g1_i4.p1 TRINITY_DN38195_c0_g1~~TRINITY_DN38195_c0_g1_i4.p1  ORF type:complete len:295 (-),score=77.50 TRINITY_DN38195_c0_g1_i4:10-894(-)